MFCSHEGKMPKHLTYICAKINCGQSLLRQKIVSVKFYEHQNVSVGQNLDAGRLSVKAMTLKSFRPRMFQRQIIGDKMLAPIYRRKNFGMKASMNLLYSVFNK